MSKKLVEAPQLKSLIFYVSGYDVPVLRIEENGDFFVKGNLVTNDKEVYEAFKEWLRKSNL